MSHLRDRKSTSNYTCSSYAVTTRHYQINPLAPKFIIRADPPTPDFKWRRLGENQYRCVLHFIILSYSRNGFSKDFIMYVRDSGGFLVSLVIRRCVNATEATMETARSVEEDWREVKHKCGARS